MSLLRLLRTLAILGFIFCYTILFISAQNTTPLEEGKTLLASGNPQQALELLQSALATLQTERDRAGTAEAFLYISYAQYELEHYPEAISSAGEALQLYRNTLGDVRGQMLAWHQYALSNEAANRLDEARTAYSRAVDAAKSAKEKPILAEIYLDFGSFYFKQRKYPEASQQYAAAIPLLQETGDQANLALAYFRAGETEAARYDLELARQNYENAAQLYQTLSDTQHEAQTRARYAATYHQEADLYNALDAYTVALDLYEQVDDPIGQSRALANLGDVYRQLGYFTDANQILNEALALQQSNGDSVGFSLTQTYRAELLVATGENRQAITLYQQILDNTLITPEVEARARMGLGFAMMLTGPAELRTALNEIEPALNIYRNTLKDDFGTNRVFIALGWIKYTEGVLTGSESADSYFSQAASVAKKSGDVRGEVNANLQSAQLLIVQRNYDRARRLYEQTIKTASVLEDQTVVGRVALAAGELEEFMTAYTDAAGYYNTAIAAFTDSPESVYLAIATMRLGQVYYRLGNFGGAYEQFQAASEILSLQINPLKNDLLITNTEGQIHLNRGILFLALDLREGARQELEQAEGIFAQTNNLADQGIAAAYLGDLEWRLGNVGGARSQYNSAIALTTRMESQVMLGRSINFYRAKALGQLGNAAIVTDGGTTGLPLTEAYDAPVDTFQEMRDWWGLQQTNLRLAELHLTRFSYNEASSKLNTALQVAQQARDLYGEAVAHLKLGDYYALLSTTANDRNVLQQYERAIEIFTNLNAGYQVAVTYEQLGLYYLKKARFNEAADTFAAMRSAYQSLGDAVGEASALNYLAQAYAGQRRYDLTSQYVREAQELLNQVVIGDYPLTDERLLAKQQIILTATRILLYISLEQYGQADGELIQLDSLNFGFENELPDVLAQLAEGELLLVNRTVLDARQVFEAARTTARDILRDTALEARACLGIARSFTLEAQIEAIAQETTAPMSPAEYEAYDCALAGSRGNPVQSRDAAVAWANAYLLRGIVSRSSSDLDAVRLYARAINDAEAARDRSGQAYALLARGDMYVGLTNYNDARNDFRTAATLFSRVEDYQGQGEALARLARLDVLVVDYPAALNNYEQMRILYTENNDVVRRAETLTFIGQLYQYQAQYKQALNFHLEAQTILEELTLDPLDPIGSAVATSVQITVLSNLGVTYLELAEYDRAQEYLEEASFLLGFTANQLEAATVTQLLANLEYSRGNYEGAIELYDTILDTYRRFGENRRLAQLYLDLGDAHYAFSTLGTGKSDPIKNGDLAVRNYNNAFAAARKVRDSRLEAIIQYRLGQAYLLVRRTSEGETNLNSALEKAQKINSTALEARIYTALGELNEQLRRPAEATKFYELAIERIEKVHTDIGYETGQIAFLTQNIVPYHRLVALLFATDPETAFAYAERGRSRTFLFQVSNEQINYGNDQDRSLLIELQQKRAERDEVQAQLETESAQEVITSQEEIGLTNRIGKLDREIAALEQGLAQRGLLAQVSQIDVSSLADIQALLPADGAMLVYYIVPDTATIAGSTLLFVIRPDQIKVLTLEPTLKDLDNMLGFFNIERELNYDENITALPTLYGWLIEPARSLLNGVQTLVIVPHNELNSVPFGALSKDGTTLLQDDYNIVYAPSATFFTRLTQDIANLPPPTAIQALVLGNPQQDNLSFLGEAETEGEEVATLFNTEAYIWDTATETLIYDQAQVVDILHIASHGVFEHTNPLASYLQLAADDTQDGKLQVREIYSLPLTNRRPLVVLSACETAVGELNQGDELQSLARAFLISGSRGVVASLWQVNDASTAALMVQFYSNLAQGKSEAVALREAQQYIREQEGWEAPYYWAGFILIGTITETTQ